MTFSLEPRGPFSLATAATFAEGFPGTEAERPDDGLRFGWAVDGDWRTVVATVRQDDAGLHVELDGASHELAALARRDVERILSLDEDATGFAALARRDPVVADLQERFPGLRPVLFFTPYEAATWAIIGNRIRMTQAAAVRRRLADELGERGAFPDPERLVELSSSQRGLTDTKVERLRGVARAALDGRLDRDRLRAMSPEAANGDLQRLDGVGPFSAELIRIRGVGDPDALPRNERRLERAVRAAYDLADDADIAPTAEAWRPYRSWVALLLRARAEAA